MFHIYIFFKTMFLYIFLSLPACPPASLSVCLSVSLYRYVQTAQIENEKKKIPAKSVFCNLLTFVNWQSKLWQTATKIKLVLKND